MAESLPECAMELLPQNEDEDALIEEEYFKNRQEDTIILGQINAHHFSEAIQGHRGSASEAERIKDYHGHPICLTTFLFLHGIGGKCFRNLLKHYKLNGVSSSSW